MTLRLPSDDVPVAGQRELKQLCGKDSEKPNLIGYYAFDLGRYMLILVLGFMLISTTERYWRPFEQLFWSIVAAS